VQPLSGGLPSGDPKVVANSEANEVDAQLSPDGKWLTYMSDITGTNEVYVRAFLSDGTVGEARSATSGGGEQPAWSRDGRELYYIDPSSGYGAARFMAMSVTSGGTLTFGAPALRFTAPILPTISHVVREYDVAPDGRFIVGAATVDAREPPAMVVVNWAAKFGK
jgi:Tol biopolymer transport system component